MFDSKAFDIFRKFSQEEIKKFNAFLKSPYFNHNKKLISLYNEVKRYYPLFTDKKLSKEKLFTKIYPNRSYRDSTIKNLFSELLGLGQRFLIIESHCKSKIDSEDYLLKELRKRNLFNLFKTNSKRIIAEIEEGKTVDWEYFLRLYKFESNMFNFGISSDRILNKKTVQAHVEHLKKSQLYMVIYMITEIICSYLNLYIYSTKFNVEEISNITERLLTGTDIKKIYKMIKGKDEYDFILEIYISLLKTFSDFNISKRYFNYKRLIEHYSDKLSHDELSFHYSRLISYCILKISFNNSVNFNYELFNLYKFVLKNEYYRDKKINYLPHDLYRAILFLALNLREYEWTWNFIQKYSNKVESEHKLNIQYFAYAFFHHAVGNYNNSLDYINKIRLDYFIYKYDLYNLKLKIYYELNYIEETLSLIHSYRQFLRTDKMLHRPRKKLHRNFINYLEKLILYKGSTKVDLGFLKHKLMNLSDITYKDWLLEKYEMAEQKFRKIG